jgi:hypothetical protein
VARGPRMFGRRLQLDASVVRQSADVIGQLGSPLELFDQTPKFRPGDKTPSLLFGYHTYKI